MSKRAIVTNVVPRSARKTLQTISLVAYLRESRGVRGPHLVIAPKSVVGNWVREFKKWCPVVKVARMNATKEDRLKFFSEELPVDPATGRHKFDVLVTSYEGLLKGKGKLGTIEWRYLVIDEAHRIKNENSSLSLVVRTMNTKFRLLLTGTPLQVSHGHVLRHVRTLFTRFGRCLLLIEQFFVLRP